MVAKEFRINNQSSRVENAKWASHLYGVTQNKLEKNVTICFLYILEKEVVK